MAFESLAVSLTADASDFVSGTEAAADSSRELGDASENAADQLFDVKPAGVAAGGALVAVGTAAQTALDDTRELRSELNQTAVTLGVSADEMNALAREASTAALPLGETSGMMEVLAERGVESTDEMRALSGEFGTLAQAVGTDAPQATQTAIQSMRAFGLEIDDISEKSDVFTFVARNTSLEFDEFGDVVSDIQPVIGQLGLTIEDTAAIMAALEAKGVGAQRAQELFAQAAEDADGSQAKLLQNLGLTEAQLASQRQELANSKGATEEYAAANESTITTMDRLRQGFDEAKLAAADYLGPISAAAPALQGMGMAGIALSTVNFGAVIPSLLGVMTTLTPILPILIAVAAGAALLWKAWDSNFLGIQNVTADVVDGVKRLFGRLMDAGGALWDFYTGMWKGILDGLFEVLDFLPGVNPEKILGDFDTDAMMETLFPPKPGEKAGERAGEAAVKGAQNAVVPSTGMDVDTDAIIADAQRGASAAPGSISPQQSGQLADATASPSGSGGTRGGGLSPAAIRNALEGLALRLTGGELELSDGSAEFIRGEAEVVIDEHRDSIRRRRGTPR